MLIRNLQERSVVVIPVSILNQPASSAAAIATSHLPWRAPIGHRQPRRAYVEPIESKSSWDRQQDGLDKELDRKLAICLGC